MTVQLYDKKIVNQGMILDLPFFEGQGTIVHDLSRHHNNGVFPGAPSNPTWTQLASGIWVLTFDGTDDYFQIPDSPLWALGQLDFSFEVWLNKTGLGLGTIFSQVQDWLTDYTVFTSNPNSVLFCFGVILNIAGATQTLVSPLAATIGFTATAWHHIVLTRSNVNTWILYYNGRGFPMTGDTGMNIPNFAANLTLGCLFDFFGAPASVFDGSLDRPRLCVNHAYTAEEVRQRYLSTRGYYT